MKLYLLNGIYYEKQADVPKGQGRFETVEFPFSASPKSDFVDWMNKRAAVEDCVAPTYGEPSPQIEVVAKPTPAPQQPPEQAPNWKADSVMVWVLDEAKPAQIEQLFAALGARFHEEVK